MSPEAPAARAAAANPVRRRIDMRRGRGERALCCFLVAGDPDPATSDALADALVAHGVDVVEYCAPFARSVTDGEVVRTGYERALAGGTDLRRTLGGVARLARSAAVTLLADYRETVRPCGLDDFVSAARDHGAGALLVHGLPPLLGDALAEACEKRGVGLVATLYPGSDEATVSRALARASAFLYLVSAFGRSGGRADPAALAPMIRGLKARGDAPVALGFGLRDPDDHRAAFAAGADMTITGSALTALIGRHRDDPKALMRAWDEALAGLDAARRAFSGALAPQTSTATDFPGARRDRASATGAST